MRRALVFVLFLLLGAAGCTSPESAGDEAEPQHHVLSLEMGDLSEWHQPVVEQFYLALQREAHARELQNVTMPLSDGQSARVPPAVEAKIQRLTALFEVTVPVGTPLICTEAADGVGGTDYVREEIAARCRALAELRRGEPALRHGAFGMLDAMGPERVFAFSRTLQDESLVVVLNRSGEAHSLRVPLPERLRGPYRLRYVVNGVTYRVQQDPTGLILETPAYGGLVLERQ